MPRRGSWLRRQGCGRVVCGCSACTTRPGGTPGWTVSVVYVATVGAEMPVKGADDARDARWFHTDALPQLAFDHDTIVADALALLLLESAPP